MFIFTISWTDRDGQTRQEVRHSAEASVGFMDGLKAAGLHSAYVTVESRVTSGRMEVSDPPFTQAIGRVQRG